MTFDEADAIAFEHEQYLREYEEYIARENLKIHKNSLSGMPFFPSDDVE